MSHDLALSCCSTDHVTRNGSDDVTMTTTVAAVMGRMTETAKRDGKAPPGGSTITQVPYYLGLPLCSSSSDCSAVRLQPSVSLQTSVGAAGLKYTRAKYDACRKP
jgi:hypothetical protein